MNCYNKVINHYDFIQNILAYSKENKTKIFEVDKNEKLESMVISKLNSDMIYTCPNCNKDLILLITSNPEDSNYKFEISLVVVNQIEKSVEENQISEDTIEFVNTVCTQKLNTESELHELLLNHDIIDEDITNDDKQDIKRTHSSQNNTDSNKNPHMLQKIDVPCKLNKSTNRKFQESVSITESINSTKLRKLEARLDVIEQDANELNSDYDKSSVTSYITFQSINNDTECFGEGKEEKNNTEYTIKRKTRKNNKNLVDSQTKLDTNEESELNNDYDKSSVTGLITFQQENNDVCLGSDIEIKDDNTTHMMETERESKEDDASDIDIPKSNLKHVCNLCGARYISQTKYKFHMERHRLNKVDKCVCLICDKETKNESLLWDHYLHIHMSPTRYICLECNGTFSKKSNLNEHQKKYKHSGYKEMLNIETDEDNNQTQEIITKQKKRCTVCRKLMKDTDPNAINDLATCASCEDSSACLMVDGEETKVLSQRQYHCLKCRKHFMRLERLEFHEMRHNENMDEFICSTCGKEFSGENSLYEHYLFVHKGARPHVCEVCGKSFQLKARLKEHHRKHTGEKPYQCEICGLRCMTTHALKFHKKSHLSTRHTCEICGKSFLKKQNLNEHLEKHWKKDKNISLSQVFTCPVCNYDLPTFRMLKHHMIGIHQLDRQDPLIMKQKPLYECNECQEKFKHQMSLKAHKEKVHEGKVILRIFQCDMCKAEFRAKQMLINHIKNKHSDEKQYKCEQCNIRFTDIKTLYHHMLLHTGNKPFTCEYCNMNFRRKDTRDAHRHKHTNNRPYKCTDCNKSFGSYTSRSNHRKKIHGDNEMECPECGEKCGDMQDIRIHLNNHLGEKLNKLEST